MARALRHRTGRPRRERVPVSLGVHPPSRLLHPGDPPGAGSPLGLGLPAGVLTPLSPLCLFQARSPASASPEADGRCPWHQACPLPVAGHTHTQTHRHTHIYALCTMLAGSPSPSLAHGGLPQRSPSPRSLGAGGVGSEPPPSPCPPALVSPSDKEQQVRTLVPLHRTIKLCWLVRGGPGFSLSTPLGLLDVGGWPRGAGGRGAEGGTGAGTATRRSSLPAALPAAGAGCPHLGLLGRGAPMGAVWLGGRQKCHPELPWVPAQGQRAQPWACFHAGQLQTPLCGPTRASAHPTGDAPTLLPTALCPVCTPTFPHPRSVPLQKQPLARLPCARRLLRTRLSARLCPRVQTGPARPPWHRTAPSCLFPARPLAGVAGAGCRGHREEEPGQMPPRPQTFRRAERPDLPPAEVKPAKGGLPRAPRGWRWPRRDREAGPRRKGGSPVPAAGLGLKPRRRSAAGGRRARPSRLGFQPGR